MPLRRIWIAVVALTLLPATNASATSILSQKAGSAGCVTEQGVPAGCADGRGLAGPTAIALSPDGAYAYVTTAVGSSVVVLTRDPADGTLAPIPDATGCYASFAASNPECTGVRAMAGALDLALSPDGADVYVAAPGDDAVAVFDRDPESGKLTLSGGEDGCINQDGSNGCADGRALDGAAGVVVSPDGKNVYVASENTGGGIAVFDRDPDTGDLTQKAGADGCLHNSGGDGCTDDLVPTLGVRNLAISADGETLYAVAPASETVAIYSRDGETGGLTPRPAPGGCIAEFGAGGCRDATGLGEPTSLTIGPGGDTAYVVSERNDAILVLERDPVGGGLAQRPGTAGCISNTGWSDPMQPGTAGSCVNGVAMDGVNSIAVLPDGSAAYATAAESDGVVAFRRDPDGRLTQLPGPAGCITETGFEVAIIPETAGFCGDGRGLKHANSLIAGHEGRYVYTTAGQSGVGTFDVVEPPVVPQVAPPVITPAVVPVDGGRCRVARRTLRRAERRLASTQRAIRRRARRSGRVHRRKRLRRIRRAQRRARRRMPKLQRARRRAARRAVRVCGPLSGGPQ